MLPCKQPHFLGIWYTLDCPGELWQAPLPAARRIAMSKTFAIVLPTQATLFQRFLAILDRCLMASAEAAIRNNEPSYFGL
jgi:hypothetical protein